MDSKRHVSFSAAEETQSSSGSLLIRAPLTTDSDFDYGSNSNETESTSGGSTVNSFENNNNNDDSELELGIKEFFSGDEEFDASSERWRLGLDEDNDTDSLENSSVDEENSGVSIGFMGSFISNLIVPIAQLSRDNEGFSEMFTDDEKIVTDVEDGEFSGAIQVESDLEDFIAKGKGLSLDVSKFDEGIPLQNPEDERIESKPVDKIVVSDMEEFKVEETRVEVGEPMSCQSTEGNNGDIIIVNTGNVSLFKTADGDTNSDPFKFPASLLGLDQEIEPEVEAIDKHIADNVCLYDESVVQMICRSSETTSTSLSKVAFEDQIWIANQQIVMDSDEAEAKMEHEAKELLNSAALATLSEDPTDVETDGGGLTVTSPCGSRVFSLDCAAHSGSSFHSLKVAPSNMDNIAFEENLSDEDKLFERLQLIRVKFLRLVHRLGHSPNDPMVAQVLYRLASGNPFCQEFILESSMKTAMQLEAEGKDELDFSLTLLVLGKTGVGKSASINSIFCEQKSMIDAFEPATTTVKEIVGTFDGVKIKIFDTPGLRSPVTEEATNCKLLASIKRSIRKFPPDVVLYVDRLDTYDRDLTDFLLLKSVTDSLGSSIWEKAIVTLTHAASACPEGPVVEPLSFEAFVSQRSNVVHRGISQAVGDLRLMNPSMIQPVALVENHLLCQGDRNGEFLLPNGKTWRSQLLLLCYSVKILSEASCLSKPQDPLDHHKLFSSQIHSPPLPYFLSSLLRSRPHPKLPNNQGDEDAILEIELGDSSNYDEYDKHPPFKSLRRSQVDKLCKEQRKPYFEENDYRVKLLQKKQWRNDVKRLMETKKKEKDGDGNDDDVGDNANVEEVDPTTISVPLPEMVLPPSFNGDNLTYLYRFSESASQLLTRPVLDSQVWDHDIGYDGVSLERSLAIAGYLPGAFAVQITKDKREFNVHLDSSVHSKHRGNGSTVLGFDIQTVGKQLAYVLRTETRFRNFNINGTTVGLSGTFFGGNMATGVKIEDRISIGKRLVLAGNAGAVACQGQVAYGANIEIRLKDNFPVEQIQTILGLSFVKWRHDPALMDNLQSQFSIGCSSSVAVHGELKHQFCGQITLKVSSSEQLYMTFASLIPIAVSIFRMIYPGSDIRKF
ncbi:translocase of chloroplast 159, chloroplastic [Gossypium arboreum]|uniref:AIG1-type G domain-containing protein n=1 Tax=Gossypium arboreum TaxID=29729 RepID=A0ABR0NHF4_GOSAR|nr:translocase of chloroplast 159, chloroplastic [Gossypium arboreum]KAK5794439.1 hypothetical protein PVK06_035665 [Gossypium arboreum]